MDVSCIDVAEYREYTIPLGKENTPSLAIKLNNGEVKGGANLHMIQRRTRVASGMECVQVRLQD